MSYFDLHISRIPAKGGISPAWDLPACERMGNAIDAAKSHDYPTGAFLSIHDNGEMGDGLILSLELDKGKPDELLWISIPNESLETVAEALMAVVRLRKTEDRG